MVLGGGAVALLTRGGDNAETIVLEGTTIASPVGSGEVPPGAVGTRDAPVPAGQVADIGLGWRLQVLDVVPDASELMTVDEFFEPAPDGFTFMLVKVALGYYGTDDPKAAIEPLIGALNASSVDLDTCSATVPDEADFFVQMFSGGVVVGNMCFMAPVAEAGTFQLHGKGDYFADEGVYLELGTPTSPVEPIAPLLGPQAGALQTPGRLDAAPVGTAAAVGAEWQLTVTSAPRDITNEVAAEVSELAPTGFHFVGVDVTFLFNGDGVAAPFEVAVRAVDSRNAEYAGYCESTDGLEYIELSAGGSTSGTLCFILPNNVEGLQLFATTFDFDGVAWFATS